MAQLREQHDAGDSTLEELFLKLTGGVTERELSELFAR